MTDNDFLFLADLGVALFTRSDDAEVMHVGRDLLLFVKQRSAEAFDRCVGGEKHLLAELEPEIADPTVLCPCANPVATASSVATKVELLVLPTEPDHG